MEGLGCVEPQVELLLSVSFALSEDVGVNYVWFSGEIPQELEIDLVVHRPLRRQLQAPSN